MIKKQKTHVVKLPDDENVNCKEVTLMNGWTLKVNEPVTWDEL